MHNDPHEPHARVARYRKSAVEESFLVEMNRLLRDAPALTLDPYPPAAHLPIIYVVGAPRSGTTLLSQLLSRYLPVGYINNLIARFWLRPSVGIRLSRMLLGEDARKGIAFESTHGVSPHVCGPHEFGYFWRAWLRLDESPTHHLTPALLAGLDAQGLQRALVHEILSGFRAPTVFKNVICGLHAEYLTRLHPRSLFVHIRRDAYATAASILQSRKERYGSYAAWWSLKPSDYLAIAALDDPAAQVARQVVSSLRGFERELSAPNVRAVTVDYEAMCTDPRAALETIANAVTGLGTEISVLGDAMPQFTIAGASQLPDNLSSALRMHLATAMSAA